MTQPEALRLANDLEIDYHGDVVTHEAAAELRRLHAENEALQNTKHHEAPRGFVLNPDYLVPELMAQRDALLKLLKEARKIIRATSSRNLVKDWDQRTTAAIKAVEENT